MDQGIGKSFGAEIKLSLPASDRRQLFFVKSSSSNVDLPALVRRYGGRVVLQGRAWTMAELGFREATGLRKAKGIAAVGGVSLDPGRFAAFNKLAGGNPS